jgi:hypothetical protein
VLTKFFGFPPRDNTHRESRADKYTQKEYIKKRKKNRKNLSLYILYIIYIIL